jgi:hypothetical protein
MHLAFHCVAIRQLSPQRNWLSKWLWRQAYRGLMAGTALTVYVTNRRTFRAGGYGLVSFCAAIANEYGRVEQLQRPGSPIALRGGLPSVTTPAQPGPAGAWQWPAPHLRVVR